MRTRRLILALVLLTCGFVAGLVITGRLQPAGNDAGAQSPVPPPAVAAPAPAIAAATLPDFSRVAEQTVPAVANISSLQVVRRRNSPFNNDPFFQFFFGDGDLAGPRRGVERSLGSGVIVSQDGFVLTNNHVVAGESGRISLRQLPAVSVALADKREVEASIVGVDPA